MWNMYFDDRCQLIPSNKNCWLINKTNSDVLSHYLDSSAPKVSYFIIISIGEKFIFFELTYYFQREIECRLWNWVKKRCMKREILRLCMCTMMSFLCLMGTIFLYSEFQKWNKSIMTRKQRLLQNISDFKEFGGLLEFLSFHFDIKNIQHNIFNGVYVVNSVMVMPLFIIRTTLSLVLVTSLISSVSRNIFSW